jgi:hypothetical protein
MGNKTGYSSTRKGVAGKQNARLELFQLEAALSAFFSLVKHSERLNLLTAPTNFLLAS